LLAHYLLFEVDYLCFSNISKQMIIQLFIFLFGVTKYLMAKCCIGSL